MTPFVVLLVGLTFVAFAIDGLRTRIIWGFLGNRYSRRGDPGRFWVHVILNLVCGLAAIAGAVALFLERLT